MFILFAAFPSVFWNEAASVLKYMEFFFSVDHISILAIYTCGKINPLCKGKLCYLCAKKESEC